MDFFLLLFEGSISSRYLMSKTKYRRWTPQKCLSVGLNNVPTVFFCIFLCLSLAGQGSLQWRWGLRVHQIFLITCFSQDFLQFSLCYWAPLIANSLPVASCLVDSTCRESNSRSMYSPVSDKSKWPNLATDSWTFVVMCFSRGINLAPSKLR